MAYSAGFWNFIAKRYARSPVANEALYQRKLKETQRFLTKEMEALEFGCGTGSTAIVLAPFVKQYLATDVATNMVEIAETKRAEKQLENLRFQCIAFEELKAEDASFNAVLAHSILHLLDDPQAAIAKAYRLLKPGGIFVSSTACIKNASPFFRFIAPIFKVLGFLPSVQVFSHEELEGWINSVGFTIKFRIVPDNRSEALFLICRKPG